MIQDEIIYKLQQDLVALEKYNSELCIEIVVLLNELSLVKKENKMLKDDSIIIAKELTEQIRLKNKYAILVNKAKEKTNDIN